MVVGDATRRKIGKMRWNKRIKKLIGVLETVFNYDHLYLGRRQLRRVSISSCRAM